MRNGIVLVGADKEYGRQVKVPALRPTNLQIAPGEVVVILGPSGSGKTTLLNLIGGLDRPTRGRVQVDGVSLEGLSEKRLGEYRREHVGFVFQFFNLVPSLTAEENIRLAADIARLSVDTEVLLKSVGLEGMGHRFPAELSGGQQQRVAIARALAKKPKVLLCDEPTGALDQETGAAVLDLLQETAKASHCTVLIVTHDPDIALRADRVIRLRDGGVVGQEARSTAAAKDAPC